MKKIFVVYALLFGLTTVYHIVGLFVKVNDSPPIRHLLFAVITAIMAYMMIKRPNYLPYLFAILLSQQLHSHGKDIYQTWTQEGKIDWISANVVLLLPCIFVSILIDAKARNRSSNR